MSPPETMAASAAIPNQNQFAMQAETTRATLRERLGRTWSRFADWFWRNRHQWVVVFLLEAGVGWIGYAAQLPGYATIFGLPVSVITPILVTAAVALVGYYLQYIGEFFLFCAGAKREALELAAVSETQANATSSRRHVTARGQYITYGATICLSAGCAWVSGGFAAYYIFKQTNIAVMVGLMWAVIIFNLDRAIVSSMRRQNRPRHIDQLSLWERLRHQIPWGELFQAVPRLLVAVVIAVTVSKPLELTLLHDRLDIRLLEKERIRQIEAFGPYIDELDTRIANLQEDQKAADADIATQRAAASKAFNEGTVGYRGNWYSVKYTADRAVEIDLANKRGWAKTLAATKAEREKAVADRKAIQMMSTNTLAGQLPSDQADFVARLTALEELEAGIRLHAIVTSPQSVVERQQYETLERQKDAQAKMEGRAMSGGSLAIFSVLLLIELAPIFLKIINAFSPTRTYEDALDTLEDMEAARRLEVQAQETCERAHVTQISEAKRADEIAENNLKRQAEQTRWQNYHAMVESSRLATEQRRLEIERQHAEATLATRQRLEQLRLDEERAAQQQQEDIDQRRLESELRRETARLAHEAELHALERRTEQARQEVQLASEAAIQIAQHRQAELIRIQREIATATTEAQRRVAEERIRQWEANHTSESPQTFRNTAAHSTSDSRNGTN